MEPVIRSPVALRSGARPPLIRWRASVEWCDGYGIAAQASLGRRGDAHACRVDAVGRFGRGAVVDAVRAVLGASARGARLSMTVGDAVAGALARLEAGARAEPAAGVQPHRHGAAHQSRPRADRRGGGRGRGRGDAQRGRARIRPRGGRRGERDDHVRGLLCELTGAEDATVVNNNAAAVLLVLNTLALGREAIVSRGELIEIGGAFRMPDIMARAGAQAGRGRHHQPHASEGLCRARSATGPALMLKVHTSNYRIEGFTTEVGAARARRASRASATCRWCTISAPARSSISRASACAHEPTVAEAIADGADLVTFSGDKLLGGPQAGFIVGRKELIDEDQPQPDEARAARRQDAARGARGDAAGSIAIPDRLAERLPTLRLLARPKAEIAALAQRARRADRRRARRRPCGRDGATARARSAPARCRSRPCRARGLRLRPRQRAGGTRAQRARGRAARLADAGDRPHRGAGAGARPALPRGRATAFLAQPRAGSSRRMIVGTAGHIDHGKTALVRALTGVDTDRLKEEKARGISIDLGFAYLPAPDGSDARLRRRAGAREVRAQHAGRRDRHRFRAAGRRGRRRRDAADARASGDRRPARDPARHRGADQGRSRVARAARRGRGRDRATRSPAPGWRAPKSCRSRR